MSFNEIQSGKMSLWFLYFSAGKGFWAEKLGFGDFYYELGVQIIEVCLATNHRNGGLIYLDDLRSKLLASRSVKNKDDITK